jgi:hypothetical protein
MLDKLKKIDKALRTIVIITGSLLVLFRLLSRDESKEKSTGTEYHSEEFDEIW